MKKPELKEIADYMDNQQEALLFYSYYESIAWKVGKNPMKSWKMAATGWLTRNKKREKKEEGLKNSLSNEKTDIVNLFWKRMIENYGYNKWVKEYGPEPTKPWINFIANADPHDIAHGLQELLKEGKDWPPSLPRFIFLCKNKPFEQKALTHAITRDELMGIREKTMAARSESINSIRSCLN